MAVTPNSIITPQAPMSATQVVVAANTAYDTPSANVLILFTTGAQGGRLTKLSAIPRATVTATQLQVFISPDGGTTKRFVDSALMAAYTMAQTTEAPTTDFGYSEDNAFILGPNESIYVGAGVALATGIVFRAEWGNY